MSVTFFISKLISFTYWSLILYPKLIISLALKITHAITKQDKNHLFNLFTTVVAAVRKGAFKKSIRRAVVLNVSVSKKRHCNSVYPIFKCDQLYKSSPPSYEIH